MEIFEFEAYDRISEVVKTRSLGVICGQSSLDFFLIQSSSGHPLFDSAYNAFVKDTTGICLKALEKYYPDKKLQDIEWSYSAGGGHSDFYFDSKSGLATSLTFSNSAVLEPYCSALPIEEYQSAINDPRGLSAALLDGYTPEAIPSFSGSPKTIYLVHTPHHPEKSIHQVNPPLRNRIDENPVVLVDTDKFMQHWRNQSVPPVHGNSLRGLLAKAMECFEEGVTHNIYDKTNHKLLKSDLETALKHHIPDEMAFGVGIDTTDHKIYFSNGRHRTVNFAKLGAPYIPVQTSLHNLNAFKALFEWNPDSALEYNMSLES